MKKVVLALSLFLAAGISFVAWWKISTSAVNSADKSEQSFVVARGDGVKAIARNLKVQGFIRDELAFTLLVKKLGIEKNIQAGSFKISRSMNASQIAVKLTLGTEDVWITIPEGWRSEQIIDYLKSVGIASDEGNWRLEEGKYFPDTYLVPKQITINGVRLLMRKTFDQKTANLKITDEDLILASLVEREAKKLEDRPLVASVLWNRYRIGMKLDIDATVQYAVGFTQKDGWWKKELTLADLAIRSPYNTYTNAGLPPAPICNPGLSVIDAVLNPAKTDYLYYLTDKDGNMHYASTIEQHNANVAKYLGL